MLEMLITLSIGVLVGAVIVVFVPALSRLAEKIRVWLKFGAP